jgi:predicted outer membrane repeat protein
LGQAPSGHRESKSRPKASNAPFLLAICIDTGDTQFLNGSASADVIGLTFSGNTAAADGGAIATADNDGDDDSLV